MILNLEEKFQMSSSFSKILNKKSFNSEISKLKEDIRKLNDEISNIKKEISKISDLCNIEEYIKVITLILEIVTFPRKYKLML
jgi:predicted  nucleic acid-binding Zn-ribbon protein